MLKRAGGERLGRIRGRPTDTQRRQRQKKETDRAGTDAKPDSWAGEEAREAEEDRQGETKIQERRAQEVLEERETPWVLFLSLRAVFFIVSERRP